MNTLPSDLVALVCSYLPARDANTLVACTKSVYQARRTVWKALARRDLHPRFSNCESSREYILANPYLVHMDRLDAELKHREWCKRWLRKSDHHLVYAHTRSILRHIIEVEQWKVWKSTIVDRSDMDARIAVDARINELLTQSEVERHDLDRLLDRHANLEVR